MTPPITAALQRESRTIPIVFVSVSDPIGSGFVASLRTAGRQSHRHAAASRRASPASGWRCSRRSHRALRALRSWANPKTTAYDYFLRAAKATAPSLAIELCPAGSRPPPISSGAIVDLSHVPNSGLLSCHRIPRPPVHRDLIIALATRHRLPSVYSFRFFVAAGGLMSYGIDQVEMFRQAASYVDRILRGAKPADLPVQAPTKYETDPQPQDREGARPRRAAVAARCAPTR